MLKSFVLEFQAFTKLLARYDIYQVLLLICGVPAASLRPILPKQTQLQNSTLAIHVMTPMRLLHPLEPASV